MYPAPYGFGNAAGQQFNAAPPGHNPQMQPGPGPSQPQQQMMYNQQFPIGPAGAFSGAPNPGAMMSGGAGPAGMMQNTAMPQMANHQMGYQAPFTSSPYGPGVPSTAAPQGQFNPNYMMPGSMGGFPMNAQQQMMQRMQHSQHSQHSQQNPAGMGNLAPQRQFSGPQGTPNPGQQGQFGAPQNPQGTPQNQAPTQAPQSANSVTTPQTPNFPSTGGQGAAVNGSSTPLSPGTHARDQQRISLLLDINQELLYEAVHLKHNLEEMKKEVENPTSSATAEQQKGRKEEEDIFSHDWTQVYRRLQANLQYLATLADRKGQMPTQPAPAYLSPPPLNLKLKFRPLRPTPESDAVDGSADREERDRVIRDHYQKLQALFPGIDPTKEPTFRPQPKASASNPVMAMQNAQRMATAGAAQGQMQANTAPSPMSLAQQSTPQMSPVSGPPAQ